MNGKTIISGSRNITNKQLVRDIIKESPHNPYNGTLLVGDAKGVDELAKGVLHGYTHVDIIEFEADFKQYGSSAGPIRNRKMAKEGDALIAIWNGESPGTKNMIDCAMEEGLDIYVKVVDTEDSSIFDY